MIDRSISQKIEQLLVARNPRGMQTVRQALEPGYLMRGANMIKNYCDTVLIGTGFPVGNTFETDGPPGAIALYKAIEALGGTPILACCDPLAKAIQGDYNVHRLIKGSRTEARLEAETVLQQLKPSLVISIEHPGHADDGNYYNMRGEDISTHCSGFDYFLSEATCPSLGIGDGGNEAGMGNVKEALRKLDIRASVVHCDELIIADVSNWAAYGLLACLSNLTQRDFIGNWDNKGVLQYLSDRGSVDGVTRQNSLTEDGLDSKIGENLIRELKKTVGF